MANIENSILLGALIHDIGKIFARTNTSLLYLSNKNYQINEEQIKSVLSTYGGDFKHVYEGLILWNLLTKGEIASNNMLQINPKERTFYERLDLNPFIVKGSIFLHHLDNKTDLTNLKDLSEEYKDAYQKYIKPYLKKADKIEAASERNSNYKPNSKNISENLVNIFSIFSDKREYITKLPFYPLDAGVIASNSDETNIEYIFRRTIQDNYLINKRNFVTKFYQDLKDYFTYITTKDNLQFEMFLTGLLAVLKKYLTVIPADIREKYPTSSLYDHSYTVSALAYINYLSKQNGYKALLADFSGVQNYIFNLGTTKNALKRLKARSLLVQLQLKSTKDYILQKLQLSRIVTFIDAGGKFLLLIPNTEEYINKVKESQFQINKKILEKYHGDVAINLYLTEEKEIKNTQDILDLISEAHKELGSVKKHPFHPIIQENNKWEKDFWQNKNFEINNPTLCPLCRQNPVIEDNKSMCRACKLEIQLAQHLSKYNYLYLTSNFSEENRESDLLFHDIEYEININKRYVNVNDLYIFNFYDFEHYKILIKNLPSNFRINFEYLAKYIPKDENGQIITFEKLAEKSHYLAVLKGDLDNLGLIFKNELQRRFNELKETNQESLSVVRTFSRMIRAFFELFLNQYIKKNFPDIAIIYAGGDDFLLLGPWDKIIKLNIELDKRFRTATNNASDLHFSTSITLFKPSTPIKNVIEHAESNLSNAKYQDVAISGNNKLPSKHMTMLFNIAVPFKTLYSAQDSSNLSKFVANNLINSARIDDNSIQFDSNPALILSNGISYKTIEKNYIGATLIHHLYEILTQFKDSNTEEQNLLRAYIIYKQNKEKEGSLKWKLYESINKDLKDNNLNSLDIDKILLNYILYKLRFNNNE